MTGSLCVIRVIAACALVKMRALPNFCRLAGLGPLRCHRHGARYGGVLRVVCLLKEPYMDPPSGPAPSLLPRPRIPPDSHPRSNRPEHQPDWESTLLASCSAHSASAIEILAPSSVGLSCGRYISSTRPEYLLKRIIRCRMAVSPPGPRAGLCTWYL